MDCVFCGIRDGLLPSTRVAEDERALAIMDINPINEGHVLVLWTLVPGDPARIRLAAERIRAAL